MSGLLRLTAPTALLALDEVKLRLRIDESSDDAGLQRLISAATRQAEQKTQRAFVTQRWAYVANYFPSAGALLYQSEQQSLAQLWPYVGRKPNSRDEEIVLPLPPLQSVESIQYYDNNGTLQTLSPSDYIVDTSRLLGVITPAPNKVWPATQNRAQAVRIEFTCGYGAAAAVEPDIALAVLLLIGHFDQNREAVSDRPMSELPLGVQSLLAPYVIPSKF